MREIDIYQFFESFEKFGEFAKHTNHMVQLLGHVSAGASNISDFFKNKSVKTDFEHIYHLKNFDLIDKRNISVFKVEEEDLLNAHYLICSLFFRYRVKSNFSEIRIIGNNGQLNELTTDDCYIELSYLDRSKVKEDTDLFVIEKEGNEIKRKKRSRSEVYSNYLSTNTVSEALIINFEQSVIIGNPGAGKSTFAKWLCHQWANQKVEVPFVLLYINLRELDFSQKKPIVDYIIQEYAPNCKDNSLSIETILRNFSFDFKYILDGLDEIDHKNKVKLEQELRRLTNKKDLPPFILLSRPYGISNTFFQGVRHFNEILGFNETQRELYVSNVLSINEREDKSTIDFLKSIEDNLVLRDISYNPLMLSYMVLIYLDSRDKAQEIFNKIYSPYQLQDTILRLLMQYHERAKKIELSYYSDKLNSSKMISGEMELNKDFVYKGNSRDKYKESAILLSELGVGRYEALKIMDEWQFYFTSITFQEFLAAEFYGEKLNPEAFIYLFGDIFFWNFSKMLLGWLSVNNKNETLEQIFFSIEKKYSASKNLLYYQRIKYLILGELSPNFIQEKLNNEEIAKMIDVSYWATFDNLRGELFVDSVNRIYLKLNTVQKEYFISFIPHYLSYFLQLESTEAHKIEFPESIVKLINNLGLINQPKIITCLFQCLRDYHVKSEEIWEKVEVLLFGENEAYDFEGTEEERLLNTYDFSMIEIYELLKSAGKEHLSPYENKIQDLLNDFPDSLEDRSLELKMIVYSAETHFQKATEQYNFAKSTFENSLQQTDNSNVFDPQMIVLSQVCVGLSKAYKEHAKEDKEAVIALLMRVEKLLQEYCASKMCIDADRSSIYTSFTEALININEPQFFDLIFKYTLESRVLNLFDVADPDAYLDYLDNSFEQLSESANILNDFEVILIALQTTSLGRLSIYKYRERIFETLHLIVSNYNEELNSYFITNESDLTTSKIVNLMEAVNTTFSYPYDRKYLLEKYKEENLIQVNYIKWNHLPMLLKEEISFNENWIWDYIDIELTEKKNLFLPVIEILDNELVYNFPSNFLPVKVLWNKLFSFENQRYFDIIFNENHFTIFSGIYFSLINYCIGDTTPDTLFHVRQVSDFLRIKEIKEKFYSVSNFNQAAKHVESLALYPLAAYLSKDVSLIASDRFHELLKSKPGLYRKVSSELMFIFKADISMISKYTPKLVYNQVESYFNLDREVNYNLDKDKFVNLLN